jgi:hypothetical protein
MKLQPMNDNGSNVFLTGAILLANFDVSGLTDYALKALVGGAIWMAFRLIADYFSTKIKK